MQRMKLRSTWFAIGALWAALVGSPVAADDTELFLGDASAQGQPNILFILDTSGSMRCPPRSRDTTGCDGRTDPTGSKLDIMQDVSMGLLDSITGANVGLMTFNYPLRINGVDVYGHGGSLIHEVADIATARESLKARIGALSEPAAFQKMLQTSTPLSETLGEAALYFMGRPIDQGIASVAGARTPTNPNVYKSPVEYECQKNFIVLLTDGEPARDWDKNQAVPELRDEASPPQSFRDLVGGTCDVDPYVFPESQSDDRINGSGKCLDDLAEFLYKADVSNLPGQQNVTTFTIGFDTNFSELADTARRGGGEYRTSRDPLSLSTALTEFVQDILDVQTTFAAPTVTIDSMNRTRNLNDLYISMFKPTTNAHWPGNLKKYRLRAADGEIVDARGAAAIDASDGFFATESRSFWSQAADPGVEQGGAADRLPPPADRKVYTWLNGQPKDLTHGNNRVVPDNPLIDETILGIDPAGDLPRAGLIDFIRGYAPGGAEARNQIGDPFHSQPITVVYDGDANGAASGLVFLATNDGFLHAIDMETGVEEWAFVPEELLADQAELYANGVTRAKHYGIDGSLRLQMLVDNDEIVEPGTEKVYLFFGMRRGGDSYYALDVTDRSRPKLLWRKDGQTDLPGIGQTWSNPVPARIDVDVNFGQNDDKLVVVFGGGYDESQDNFDNAIAARGNAVFIVDSETGAVLWHGSKTSGNARFDAMQSPIPADVRVVDLDGDGFADRMYAADLGGQIWRFDIHNGERPDDLVTGGVIARLGAAPLPADTEPDDGRVPPAWKDGPDNRRFFYAPDVALVSRPNGTFIHIGIGSGYRAHPVRGTANRDRFYALRDYAPFQKLTEAQYDDLEPITHNDLAPLTGMKADVSSDKAGWYLDLPADGEKVLAEARTFNNQIFFTTFVPNSSAASASADPCAPATARNWNRLYVVSLFDGSPITNLDGEVGELTEDDRYREFPGTITSEVVFLFPSPDEPGSCVGNECTPPPFACVDLFCLDTGFGNNPVRTFWSQRDID